MAGDVRMPLDPEMQLDHETCAQDLVDFAPVYRCLHIHSVLVGTVLDITRSSLLSTPVRAKRISSLKTIDLIVTSS